MCKAPKMGWGLMPNFKVLGGYLQKVKVHEVICKLPFLQNIAVQYYTTHTYNKYIAYVSTKAAPVPMMMEWEKQQQQHEEEEEEEIKNGMFVKVMTDEQMEILRKQIAAYATICDHLVLMHKSLSSNPLLHLSGDNLGNTYCDPLLTSVGHKITGRQRWTPTPVQLQILERMFDQGNGTPTKQKIKEITSELSQHGQISETNVYNWFQNRRARSKRKQNVAAPNTCETEVETEVEAGIEYLVGKLEDSGSYSSYIHAEDVDQS